MLPEIILSNRWPKRIILPKWLLLRSRNVNHTKRIQEKVLILNLILPPGTFEAPTQPETSSANSSLFSIEGYITQLTIWRGLQRNLLKRNPWSYLNPKVNMVLVQIAKKNSCYWTWTKHWSILFLIYKKQTFLSR